MIWGAWVPAQVSPCIILKGERDKKHVFFAEGLFGDRVVLSVLEVDQHDLCLSRILPRRILTSEFLSRAKDKAGSDVSSSVRVNKDYD